MKKLLIPSVLALSLVAAPLAMAMPMQDQPMPKPMQQGGPGVKMHGKKNHGMTKEQRQQIRAIVMKYRVQQRALRQQARVLRMQLDGKLVTQGTSWNEISAVAKQLNKLRGQMYMLRTQARFEVFQKTGMVMPSKGYRGKHRMRHGR